ncbi:MAG: hypothetical protein ROO73_03575 [Roseivirga sp.]
MRLAFYFLLLLAPLTARSSASGQPFMTRLPAGANKPVLRRAAGLTSLSLLAGRTQRAPYLALGTAYHCSSALKGQLAFGLATRRQKNKIWLQGFMTPSLLYLLWTDHKQCFLSLQAGPLIAYRWQQAPRKRGHFHVGLLVGLEGELFLYRSFSISLEIAPCYYLLKSPYPPLDYILTLGLSYTF